MIQKISALIFVFSILFVSCKNEAELDLSKKFDPKSDPQTDLKFAITQAQSYDKRILLDVGGEWCKWCHILDDFIKKTPAVKSFIEEHYIVVKVNYSEENKNEKFLMKFPLIQGYPHFFILDKNGMLLQSQETGSLEENGSYSKQKMMEFLKQWAG
ncbi:MAG: thioredoxin family protein [bacterium]